MIARPRRFPPAAAPETREHFRGASCLLLLASFAFLAPGEFATAQSAPGKTDPATKALLAELAHENFAVRDQARDKLVARGAAAVPHLLEAAESSDDPEVRTLASEILTAIARSDQRHATLVTVRAKDTPLSEVARNLSRQIGGEIRVEPDAADVRLTLNLDQVPFWTAVQQIQSQTKLGMVFTGEFVSFAPPNHSGLLLSTFTSHSGPYVVVATNSYRNSMIDLQGRNDRSDSLQSVFQLIAEPKVELVERAMTPLLEVLTDENGRSLLDPREKSPESSWGRVPNAHSPMIYTIMVPQPHGPVKKIAHARGSVALRVPLASGELLVKDILNARGKAVSDKHWEIKITEVHWIGGTCDLHFRATLAPSKEGPEGFEMSNLELRDVTGTPFQLTSHEGSWDPEAGIGTFSQTYVIGLPGAQPNPNRKPATLRYAYCAKREVIRVPFEFRDLPMP